MRGDRWRVDGEPRVRWDRACLAVLVVVAVAVRVPGLTSGLPFSYNPDEELHFVPAAADAADGDLNPDYFQNPSALTYLLAVVFRIVFLGRDVSGLLASDPGAVYLVARVVVAALGVLLVLLVHAVGRRYFGTGAGLVAAALIALCFLPVHYSRQALNDVPTLVPVTIALWACLRCYEQGRWRDVLLAGGAVGVATASKYTAAPMALVVLLAVVLRMVESRERPTRAAFLLVGSGTVCVAAFLLLDPYLVVEFSSARSQLDGQSSLAASEKLGQAGTAWSGYPATLVWGFGVLPVAFAVVGLVVALRGDRALRVRAGLLVVFPVVLWAYLSTQDRFFARWLLPAYPALAILAGYGAAYVVGLLRARAPGWPRLLAPVLVAAIVLAQPVVDVARNVLVVSRTDTRTEALDWIRGHLDGGDRIVVEPSVPDDYLDGIPVTRYPVERPYESYERDLTPGLVDTYRAGGYCWVLVNSFQRDRGLAGGLEGARAYYAELDRQAASRTVFSPYRDGAGPVPFSYDLSFNWYPRAYERPGPYLEVVHLDDCST